MDGRLNFKATIDDADFNRKIGNMERGVNGLEQKAVKMTKEQQKAYERLASTIKSNQDLLKNATDPTQIALYNQRIKEATASMQKLVATASKPIPVPNNGRVTAYNSQGNSIGQMQDALGSFKDRLVGERDANNIKQLNANIQELEGNIKRTTNVGKKGFDDMGDAIPTQKVSSFSRLFGNIVSSFGIFAGLGTVVNLLRSFYDTTKQLQTLNKSMELGAKDSQTYSANLGFLKDITEQYGLELLSTSEAYNKFYIGAKDKLALDDIQMIFEKISKSASLMGLSVTDQEGIFRALQQMMSKGTVQAEELRGQLGDRLPGAFDIMARSMGVTTFELGKMMENGEVMSAKVLPKFAIELEKTFGADNVKRIENITASENRLKNEWVDLVESINSGNGIITKSIMAFYDLTSGMLSLINSKKTLSDELGKEQLGLNVLVGQITTSNVTNSRRLELLSELKKNYPEFIAMLGKEGETNSNLLSTLDNVNKSYRERIALQLEAEKKQGYERTVEKATEGMLIAENNLYEALVELNLKYNLGLKVTKENTQGVFAEMKKLAENNRVMQWDMRGLRKLDSDLTRLTNHFNTVNGLYQDFLNKGVISFTAGETIPESKRLEFEERREREFEEKKRKANEVTIKKADKSAESLAKKRLDFIFELNKAENDLTQTTLSGLDLELSKVNEVYNDRIKKAKELKATQDAFNKIESLKTKETEIVTYKADTEILKTSLEQQKTDYESFEEYKKQVGVAKAKEMYSEIIDTSKSYYDVLNDELNSFSGRDDLTALEKQRIDELFKLLQNYSTDRLNKERQDLQALIQETATYQERISLIQETYSKKRKDLEKITDEQIRNEKLSVLNQQEKDAVLSVENEVYEKGRLERDLIKSLTSYTKKELQNRLKSTREYLDTYGDYLSEDQKKSLESEALLLTSIIGATDQISKQNALLKEKERITKAIKDNTSKDPEIAKKLNKELEDVNGLIEGNKKDTISTAEGIQMAVQGANMLASAFGGVNKELQMAVEAIGNIVSALASGDMAGAVMAVAGTIIQGAVDVFGKNDTSARDSEKLRLQEEYNKMLRDQLLIEARINDEYQSRVQAIREEMEVLSGNQKSVINRMKEILNTFYELYKDFGGFGSVNDFDFFTGWQGSGLNEYFENGVELSDELLDKLIQLNNEAPLSGTMKELFDELMRLKEEFGSVDEAVKELEKELRDRLTGTTAQSLADSIREGIADGKRSFEDFANDIEGFLRNAILAGMSQKIIEPQIQQLQDMLYEMMQDGILTEEERRKFEERYAEIAQQAGEYLDLVNQAGVNMGGLDDLDTQSAKDGIKRITESQADRLTGILTGMQVDVIESRKALQLSTNLLNSSLDNLIAIEFNTRRTYEGVERIEVILQNNQANALGL